jgi:hypothetical protein
MTDEERQQYTERYAAAAHAMQTGVATEMEFDKQATTPKHLRVGVNSAMADHAGLAALLIRKGIITEDEYLVAITEQMETEKRRYETELTAKMGQSIKLW